MKNKRILITGGAGFIGSHLVSKFLRTGNEVVVLDDLSAGNKLPSLHQRNITFMEGDIRDCKLVNIAARKCDVIIHLAAVVGVDQVINQSSKMFETETIGTHNIAQAAVRHGVQKIIYASSSAVYHNLHNGKSQEEDPLELINGYAMAKRLNEKYLEGLGLEHDISVNSLRFFNVYGRRQDSRMVIPRFYEQAMNGMPIEIFGNGLQTRDFTHINDVSNSIHLLSQRHDLNGIYNISRGIETTILDLAQIIKRITNSNSEIKLMNFPKERLSYKVNRRVGSSVKLQNDIEFIPEINLEDGLAAYCISQVKKSKIRV